MVGLMMLVVDIGVIFGTGHLGGRFLVGLNTIVPSTVTKKCFWMPNTETNHLTVLSMKARTVRDTGPDGPRPGHRSGSSLHASGQSAFGAGRPRWRRGSSSPRRTLELVPGRDPIEREVPRRCYGSTDRPVRL
jgi:hypothetical protein